MKLSLCFVSFNLLLLAIAGSPQNPPPPDASRLVRVWDIGKLDRSTYSRKRAEGERMLMAAAYTDSTRQSALSAQGFTLLVSDQPLASFETAPGVWDLSRIETGAREAQAGGFAFALAGSFAYPPAWYRDRVRFTRLQCLEHGEKIEAFSPWDEKLVVQTGRAMEEIAERNPAALWLGGWGEDGRAGVFTRTAQPNHGLHPGWWCGDPLAIADFRAAMMRKYRDLDLLNAAWRTRFRRPSEIAYPAAPTAGRRYWLDFVHWYRGNITAQTIRLTEEARKSVPMARTVIPIAASLDPKGGIDLTELIKSAGDSADVSLPVEPPGFPSELVTRFTAAACRFYGASFWAESASPDAASIAGRFFTAATIGAKGFLDRSPLPGTAESYYRNSKHLRVANPAADVALLYSTSSHILNGGAAPPVLARACSELRDALEFDVVDERMIADDALNDYRLLVMCEGTVYESETLKRIEEWVRDGGVLAAYDFGKFESVEGDREWFARLFAHAGSLRPAPRTREEVLAQIATLQKQCARPFGKGWTLFFPARGKEQLPSYYELIRFLAYRMSELDGGKRNAPAVDNAWDGIYASVGSEWVRYYNANSGPKEVNIAPAASLIKDKPAVVAPAMTVPPGGITAVPLTQASVELLLQCEKFTQPGSLRAQTGNAFSPGSGPTHVLIPVGGSISTRFQCEAAGRYRVFYRAVRRGTRAGAEIEVEGKLFRGMSPPEGPKMDSATYFAGVVELERGVRRLSVRPRKGEDVRADYVVLTTDSGIGGYTFPPGR